MIRPAQKAKFAPGDAVWVRDAEVQGHHRTPRYVKGKRGKISEVLGEFPDPESLAYGGSGLPEKALYKVCFLQRDLWGDYAGPQHGDVLHVDIYEHWLEPAGEEE